MYKLRRTERDAAVLFTYILQKTYEENDALHV